MFSLVLKIISGLCLLAALAIIARKVPQALALQQNKDLSKRQKWQGRLNQLRIKQCQIDCSLFLEKGLRRFRLMGSRLDNVLNQLIIGLRRKNGQLKRQEEKLIKHLASQPKDAQAYKDLTLIYLEQNNLPYAQASWQAAKKWGLLDEKIDKELAEKCGHKQINISV